MSHGLDNCVPVLRRWAAQSDSPLPDNWAALMQSSPSEAMRIAAADPELVALLSGQAGASLRADALSGVLAAAVPSEAERMDAARAARIAELTESNPFGSAGFYRGEEFVPPTSGNVTAQMELLAIAPEIAARLQAEARPAAAASGLSAEQAAFVNAEANRLRMESMQHAMSTPQF